nr:hypothetical protein [uncultured Desulfobacter sp.]
MKENFFLPWCVSELRPGIAPESNITRGIKTKHRIFHRIPGVFRFLTVFWPVLFIFIYSTSHAHPGHYGSRFHARHLEQALEYAKQEYRIVFLHVRAAGAKRLQFFRWPGEANAHLIDLLVRETVIVELDAAENADELAGYDITAPQILLLNPDGSLSQSIDASLPVPVLNVRLNKILTGQDAVERARLNLESKGEDDFFAQERLATALGNAGQFDEAAGIYRRCAKQCIDNISLAAVGRRPKVFAAIAGFAQGSDEIQVLLENVLDSAESAVVSKPDDAALPKDLVQIYKRGYQNRARNLFDQLPQESIARHGLLDFLFDDLVEQGRYAEVMKLIDPAQAFKGEVALFQRNRILRPAEAEQGSGRGTRAFVVQRATGLVQALAGTGKNDTAKDLIQNIMAFDSKPATQKALEQSLNKLDRTDLLQTK